MSDGTRAVVTDEYAEDVIPTAVLLDAYTKMLLVRHTENAIAEDFRTNKIFSFYHSSAGQEAAAVGVCLATEKGDRVFGNHRSHGHYLACGGNLYRMICEIYGKTDGCCKGKGGSMHMLDRDAGFMGSTPILGSIVPIATGSAFQQKVSKHRNITVVFLGDGASEEGAVYESINLAATMQLPVIYAIEDNLYAVNTPRHTRRSVGFSLSKVVTGLGADFLEANGNDFSSVYTAAQHARTQAAANRPVVLHLSCFRHMAHSGPIKDESVRSIDTEDVRQQHDPITTTMCQLKSRGVSGDTLNHILDKITVQIAEVFTRAKDTASPYV